MGLRVSTNVPSLVAVRNLEKNSQEVSKSFARLSSGSRFTSAGDDAAALTISSKLEAEVRGLRQAARNANDGVSLVQTAEGALNEVGNLLIRLRELGVQAASDTLGDAERGFLDQEYQQLKAEVDRISQVTSFNGKPLLNGSVSELDFQVGAHKGAANVIKFNGSDNAATVSYLGIGGASVVTKDDATDSLEVIDSALGKVNASRAELGGLQNRLHSAVSANALYMENLASTRSRMADTDVAEESSQLVKGLILQNAGVAVLAQANQSPNAALKLL
ncbi:MAG: flagellin FliC [Bdellovibrionales bacterium]|nr:flagellin FliC [Bdellovibrionales bacterium]